MTDLLDLDPEYLGVIHNKQSNRFASVQSVTGNLRLILEPCTPRNPALSLVVRADNDPVQLVAPVASDGC